MGWSTKTHMRISRPSEFSADRKCPYAIGEVLTLPTLSISGLAVSNVRYGKVISIYKYFVLVDCGNYKESVEF